MFQGFLKSEFSEENLEFWIACEELRFASQSSIPTLAHKIYADFVAFQAPKEVSILKEIYGIELILIDSAYFEI